VTSSLVAQLQLNVLLWNGIITKIWVIGSPGTACSDVQDEAGSGGHPQGLGPLLTPDSPPSTHFIPHPHHTSGFVSFAYKAC
jgi:hypothetical protein